MKSKNLGSWLSVDAGSAARPARRRKGWLLVLPLLLAGCAVGPDYVAPERDTQPAFAAADATRIAASEPVGAWWETFGDAQLTSLVEQALAENHDLRIATANIARARAFLREDRLDRFPRVTAQGSATREGASEAVPGAFGGTETFYDAGFDATWELDLFGRVRRSVAAATADYDAAVATRHDVEVIVAAEVARAYVELRGAQYRRDVAWQNAENQRQSLHLTEVLLENGRGTQLDVSRAEAQYESTRASIAPLEAAVARAIHRLGVLVGREPTALEAELTGTQPVPALPASIAIGDPAGLLRRRADIRAAEHRLEAATARVGVATADLFPRVVIDGSAGFLSTDAGDLGNSASERFRIGPFLSWPAFDLGRVRARIDAADADVDAGLAAYEQTVLRALEETENSLVDYARSLERQARLDAATEASEEAAELARARYNGGVDSFLSVLDAERRLFEAQSTLAEAETESALAVVRLYKALGGGWGIG